MIIAYDYGTNRFVFATSKGDIIEFSKYLLVWKKINSECYAQAISFTSDAAARTALNAGPL